MRAKVKSHLLWRVARLNPPLRTQVTSTASTPPADVQGAPASQPPDVKLANNDNSENSAPNIKSFDEIPGPTENRYLHLLKNFAPVFGKFKKNQRLMYERQPYEKYGPLVRTPSDGRLPYSVFVYDPQAYADIYKMEGRYPYRAPFKALKKLLQECQDVAEPGLASLNNEDWHLKRRQLQPKMMHVQRLNAYVPAVEDITDEFIRMLAKMADGGNSISIPNVRPLLEMWNVEGGGAIAGLLKKKNFYGDTKWRGSKDFKGMHEVLIASLEEVTQAIDNSQTAIQWWKYLFNRNLHKLTNGFNQLTRVTVELAKKGLTELRERPSSSVTPLMAEIIDTYENQPIKLAGFVTDVLIGGIHTTSGTAEMLLYFLSQNPEVQSKARQEVTDIMAELGSVGITPDHFQRLRYVRACVKETLRLAPALSSQTRSFERDITLRNYNIPAKTLIYMMFNVSSTSETYFRHASRYLPERWLGEGAENQEGLRGDPYASLPFGHGPRMCIGRRIAELELHILSIKVLQHFLILPGHKVELRTNLLTYAEPPVGITLQKIAKWRQFFF